MSTITTSITLTANILVSYTWPITINSGVTISLDSNINLNTNNQYFIIGGSNIIFDGKNYKIYISKTINYDGLFQNNNLVNSNIILQYLNIISNNSTISSTNGWICQSRFCNGTVKFSKTDGEIQINSGGIFGQGCYNCISINNFTSGTIGIYAGGIFGSYCLNCYCYDSYTFGNIGNYAGGIFGFGTNYIYDGISYNPTNIIDQDGNSINELTIPNNYGIVSTSSVSNSYSLGSIGQYAGGIFGYFAYNCNVFNSYSVGNGNNLIPYTAGGIYAMNFYYTSSIYFPSSTNCSVSNSYTSGSYLATDGIFSFSNSNIITNIKTNCFSEQYNNTCSDIQIFNNCNAITVLQQIGKVWLVPNLCTNNSPFILASFIKPLYDCNYKKVKHCQIKHSKKGIYTSSYYILDINYYVKPQSITICNMTGQLNFNKVHCGDYSIRVLNGKKIYILSVNNINYSITYIDYNTCIYYLKSK